MGPCSLFVVSRVRIRDAPFPFTNSNRDLKAGERVCASESSRRVLYRGEGTVRK